MCYGDVSLQAALRELALDTVGCYSFLAAVDDLLKRLHRAGLGWAELQINTTSS